MVAILERFGVTEALLAGVVGEAAAATALAEPEDAPSDPERIGRAVDLITPERCGLPLVRVGPPHDGGYLLPDDLAGIEACFSPGTNNVKPFEDDLATRFGIRSFMCDRSSDVNDLRTPLIPGMQVFEKRWLDVGPGGDDLDINDWVRDNAPAGGDLLLQMDIEGAEYRNLMHATDATLARFRIMVLELHNLSMLGRARFLDGVLLPVLERLGQWFVCVHTHPNNCCGSTIVGDGLEVPAVVEVTLLRRDRLRPGGEPLCLPRVDDALNVVRKPPLHLRGRLRRNADPVTSDASAREQTLAWLRTGVMSPTGVLAHDPALEASIADRLLRDPVVVRLRPGRMTASTPPPTRGRRSDLRRWVHRVRGGGPPPAAARAKVGLGRTCAIDAILLLRSEAARGASFAVSLSADGATWSVVHEERSGAGGPASGGMPPLIVPVDGTPARWVRVVWAEHSPPPLDEVVAYGTTLEQAIDLV